MNKIELEILDKIKSLTGVLSELSKEHKRESMKSADHSYKNGSHISRVTLGKYVRILNWIRWVVEGLSVEERQKRDPGFLKWYHTTEANRIDPKTGIYLKETIGFDSSYSMWLYFKNYQYFNMYQYIYNSDWWYLNNQESMWINIVHYLFPDDQQSVGLFDLCDDDYLEKMFLKEKIEETIK